MVNNQMKCLLFKLLIISILYYLLREYLLHVVIYRLYNEIKKTVKWVQSMPAFPYSILSNIIVYPEMDY
jgi:hypothetical protein